MEGGTFLIVEKPHPVLKPGFPLDSLSIDMKSGKYYYDLKDDEQDQGTTEDGFRVFFRKVMEKIEEVEK